MNALRTSEIARAAGIHPNTVRLYEKLGFLPRPERGPNGYRQFTELHLDQVLLVRSLTRSTWLGGAIRQTALQVISRSADGDLAGASAEARRLLQLVQAERMRAELAVSQLEAWVESPSPGASDRCSLTIREAAECLAVTPDALRNWERNGLVRVPRQPGSRYRVYGPTELQQLVVIRALRG